MERLGYYFDLISELLKKELKVRYKNNILGYAWSIAMPLTQALIYYFAFKFIMKIPIENYALFLIIGLFPWQWFSNSIVSSINIILGNANLIKKTPFPREALIFASVLNDTVHFLLSLPIVILFASLYKVHLHITLLPALLTVTLLQFLTTLGISLLASSLNVLFRDLERLTQVVLNILFYLTPIIYDKSMIPTNLTPLMTLANPMFSIVELYRDIFLKGTLNTELLTISAVQSCITLLIGWWIFNKFKWKFSEVL